MQFKNTLFAKLDSKNFDVMQDPTGYSITAYTNSFDEPANTYLST